MFISENINYSRKLGLSISAAAVLGWKGSTGFSKWTKPLLPLSTFLQVQILQLT
jgi:hypothetical protein